MHFLYRWALIIAVVTAVGCARGRCDPDANTQAAKRQAHAYAHESAPHHRRSLHFSSNISSPTELALVLGLAIVVGIVEAIIDSFE